MLFSIESYGLSDIGLVRENNEDTWSALPESNIFVVADGMGGHQSGEIASREAVFFFLSKIQVYQGKSEILPLNDVKELLSQSVVETNLFIYELSKTHELLRGMGTTICAMQIYQNHAFIVHVGDSRVYRLRENTLLQMTKDHSLFEELIALGGILPDNQRESSCKNIITRAIGTEPSVIPSISVSAVQGGDIYLLCSDGLSDLLSGKKIQEILESNLTIEEKVRMLILAARKRGGYDNITVLLVSIT